MIAVQDIHISPSLNDVLDRPLWQGPAARSETLLAGARHLLSMVQEEEILRSRCVVGMFRVESYDGETIALQGGESIRITLPEQISHLCTHLAMSIATIGPQCETRTTRLIRNGERLNGLLLDAIGCAAVELLAESCCDYMAEMASELALKIGPVLSPGSPGFDLHQQSRIHRILDADQIGVRLSSSGMLSPVKSVSFILPLGPEMPDCSRDHTCSRCEMSGTCMFRRHDTRISVGAGTGEEHCRTNKLPGTGIPAGIQKRIYESHPHS